MKTAIKLLAALTAAALAGSCRSGFETVDKVEFEVTTASQTFKVGEPVTFTINGDPDFITFYSGEKGNDFAFKDKDRVIETEMTFSFTTTTTSGTPGYPNPARVPVSYSVDFDGEYTEQAMHATSWTDITDRFTMPTDIGATDMLSGEVNITDLFPDENTPLWFRFHYVVNPFDATIAGGLGNGRTQWNFKSPKFSGITGESSSTLYDITSARWTIVRAASYEGCTSMPDINSSRILLRSEFQPLISRECWAVAGPIYRMDFINEGPDWGVGIKSYSDVKMRSYQYTYDQPGEYTVVFVAANANAYGRKEVVREVTIHIIEDEGGITPPEKED